jgi:hypothetical protein
VNLVSVARFERALSRLSSGSLCRLGYTDVVDQAGLEPAKARAGGLRDRSLCRSGHWSDGGCGGTRTHGAALQAQSGLKVLADRRSGHASGATFSAVDRHSCGPSVWCTSLDSNQRLAIIGRLLCRLSYRCVVGAPAWGRSGSPSRLRDGDPAGASAMSGRRSAAELRARQNGAPSRKCRCVKPMPWAAWRREPCGAGSRA